MKPLLNVSQLNYQVGTKALLKSISFTVNSGELVVLLARMARVKVH